MSDSRSQSVKRAACERLRQLVPDCMAKHMYEAAIFFASKLCSMSDQHPGDIYLLAQVRA